MFHGGECYIVRMVAFGSASNSIFKEMINSIEKVIHFKVQVAFDSLFFTFTLVQGSGNFHVT